MRVCMHAYTHAIHEHGHANALSPFLPALSPSLPPLSLFLPKLLHIIELNINVAYQLFHVVRHKSSKSAIMTQPWNH